MTEDRRDTSFNRKNPGFFSWNKAGWAIVPVLLSLIVLGVLILFRPHVTVTYSLYPYLPDVDYYRAIIEEEWDQIHPDVDLVYSDYNCYYDGAPEGIDVIMYDSLLEQSMISDGYLRPVEQQDIDGKEGFFEFTMIPAQGQSTLYGVPVLLCADFLIYDRNDPVLASADSVTDIAVSGEDLLIRYNAASEAIYRLDAAADISQDASVIRKESAFGRIDTGESIGAIEEVLISKYVSESNYELARLYDEGITDGLLGYSENLTAIDNRFDDTGIKLISFSNTDNIPLFFCDMAGISAKASENKTDLCMDLVNLMADPSVLERLTVKDGEPQYLLPARRTSYDTIKEKYPLYGKLQEMIESGDAVIFRAYKEFDY